jgi:hypothetical protein
MLELLLDFPIQLIMVHDFVQIKLGDKGVLDFSGMSFCQAKEILKILLEAGLVKRERNPNDVNDKSVVFRDPSLEL